MPWSPQVRRPRSARGRSRRIGSGRKRCAICRPARGTGRKRPRRESRRGRTPPAAVTASRTAPTASTPLWRRIPGGRSIWAGRRRWIAWRSTTAAMGTWRIGRGGCGSCCRWTARSGPSFTSTTASGSAASLIASRWWCAATGSRSASSACSCRARSISISTKWRSIAWAASRTSPCTGRRTSRASGRGPWRKGARAESRELRVESRELRDKRDGRGSQLLTLHSPLSTLNSQLSTPRRRRWLSEGGSWPRTCGGWGPAWMQRCGRSMRLRRSSPHPNPLPKGEGTVREPLPKGEGTVREPLPKGEGTQRRRLPQGEGSCISRPAGPCGAWPWPIRCWTSRTSCW